MINDNLTVHEISLNDNSFEFNYNLLTFGFSAPTGTLKIAMVAVGNISENREPL